MSDLDLAPIGNCAIASLVDKDARHVWFCWPRLDGDPVFNCLLNGTGDRAGSMTVKVDRQAGVRQAYLRNSAILESVIEDATGASIRVLDWAPRYKLNGDIHRPPMLIRRIEPLSGRCSVRLGVSPTFGYGSHKPRMTLGSNYLRFEGGEEAIRMTTDAPLAYLRDSIPFLLDKPLSLVAGIDEPLGSGVASLSRNSLEATLSYWQDWVRDLAIPFDWQDVVIRAAITLKLCSYEETGAIIAAMTTSIPEAPASGRNWDYRFCWLRDSYFTVHALNRLGATQTMENFITYLLDCVLAQMNDSLSPLFPVIPARSVDEYEAGDLAGYRGMGPVRVGNAAHTQRQNDIYGAVVMAAAQVFWDERLPRPGTIDLYRKLKPLGDMALRYALTPDAGIWEYRGISRVHTFSATMCWAALHRLGHIALKLGEKRDADDWLSKAARLRQTILEKAWNSEGGYFSGSFGGSECDASVLLLPEVGLISYDDARFLSTLTAIERNLLRDGLMMRYVDKDDFGHPETAFLVCTFWYIEALAGVGRRDEAEALFRRILGLRNHVGLLSEDVDQKTGELWGNFPQTYSLVGLINVARRLSRTWELGPWDAS